MSFKNAKVVIFVMMLAASLAAAGIAQAALAAKDITIVLIPKVGVPFFDDCNTGGKTKAAELGVNYEWVVPENTQGSTQVRILEDLIARHVDGIAISVNEPASVESPIKAAIAAGIKVITFDADSANSERLFYIGTSNKQAGFDMGKAAAEQLKGKGKVAFVTGQLGALNLNERIAGVKEALLEYPGITVIGEAQGTDDDLATAVSKCEDLLRANPDLDCVFGTSQVGGPAMAKVLESQEFADRKGKCLVYAFDDLVDTMKGISDGYISATMVQRPIRMGSLSVQNLYDLISGHDVKLETIDTGCTVVTKDNATSYSKD